MVDVLGWWAVSRRRIQNTKKVRRENFWSVWQSWLTTECQPDKCPSKKYGDTLRRQTKTDLCQDVRWGTLGVCGELYMYFATLGLVGRWMTFPIPHMTLGAFVRTCRWRVQRWYSCYKTRAAVIVGVFFLHELYNICKHKLIYSCTYVKCEILREEQRERGNKQDCLEDMDWRILCAFYLNCMAYFQVKKIVQTGKHN